MSDLKNTLIISPIHETFVVGKIWMGLEIKRITAALDEISQGEIEHKIIPFIDLIERLEEVPQAAYLFYSSSYDERYQRYIRDTAVFISQVRPDIKLIPNLSSVFSFENKGYQELHRKAIGLTNLWGKYFGDIDDFDESKYTNFPYVVKKLGGALSSGVGLCHSFEELKDFVGEPKIGLKQKIKYKLRSKKARPEFSYQDQSMIEKNRESFFKFREPFILQEMIPGLKHDHKLLMFGDAIYAFKRFVREGDFRASGSGKFVWEKPSDKMLDFARTIFDKLDTPFVALDLAETETEVYLLELQVSGFGPIGQNKSDRYFYYDNGWREKLEEPDLEKTYARSFYWYINKQAN